MSGSSVQRKISKLVCNLMSERVSVMKTTDSGSRYQMPGTSRARPLAY